MFQLGTEESLLKILYLKDKDHKAMKRLLLENKVDNLKKYSILLNNTV